LNEVKLNYKTASSYDKYRSHPLSKDVHVELGWEPKLWKEQWNGIADMRNTILAPVDKMGPQSHKDPNISEE